MSRFLKALSISFISIFLAAGVIYAQNNSASPAIQTTGPKLEIITPSENQTVYGNQIPVLFSAENFELADYKTNTVAKAGQGHIHLWLDEASPTKENATKVVEDNFTYSDVPYGKHTLVAELVTNTHNSLTPPQKVTVSFTSAPISTPEAATSSGFDKKTAAVILVVVALVIVAAWWYTKDEDEEETPPAGGDKLKKTAKRSAKRAKARK